MRRETMNVKENKKGYMAGCGGKTEMWKNIVLRLSA